MGNRNWFSRLESAALNHYIKLALQTDPNTKIILGKNITFTLIKVIKHYLRDTQLALVTHALVTLEEEELVFIPRLSPPYGSLKAAYNRLPLLSPQQTPCEAGGAERALTEPLCKNSSKRTVTSQGHPARCMWRRSGESKLDLQIRVHCS